MKSFIGIVFIGIVFSVFLIPLTDAGTQDKWEVCSETINNYQKKTIDGTVYYCCEVFDGFSWVTNQLLCKSDFSISIGKQSFDFQQGIANSETTNLIIKQTKGFILPINIEGKSVGVAPTSLSVYPYSPDITLYRDSQRDILITVNNTKDTPSGTYNYKLVAKGILSKKVSETIMGWHGDYPKPGLLAEDKEILSKSKFFTDPTNNLVAPIIFLPTNYKQSENQDVINFVNEKIPGIKDFYKTHVGKTFNTLQLSIVNGNHDHEWYWCNSGQTGCMPNNFLENIVAELIERGYMSRTSTNIGNRIIWIIAMGGGGFAGGTNYPADGGLAAVGDAGIYATIDNNCNRVKDKYFSGDKHPNIIDDCKNTWIPVGNAIGHSLGALAHELGHAFGVPHPDAYGYTPLEKSIDLSITIKAKVTFSQTGIPKDTFWGVIFGGKLFSSTTSSITVGSDQVDFSNPVDYRYSSPQEPPGTRTRYVCTSGCSGKVSTTSESVSATYATQYQLTMSVSTTGWGTTSPPTGNHWYDSGSSVVITANRNSGYKFKSWSGSGTGTYTGSENPKTIVINSPITQRADFIVDPETHCSAVSPHSSGDDRDGNYRHYFETVWKSEDCTTKISDDPDGGNAPLTPGTLTDYLTCSVNSCTSTTFTDSCSGNTLTEYYPSSNGKDFSVSGSSYASRSIDCTTEFGAGYICKDGRCSIRPTPEDTTTPTPTIVCGNKICETGETTLSCPGDCPTTPTPTPTPTCSLAATPASDIGPFSSLIKVSYSSLSSEPNTITINCGAGAVTPTVTAIDCKGTTGLCSASCRYPLVRSETRHELSASASGTSCSPVTVTNNPGCVYSLAMKNLPKTNTYRCTSVPCEYKWDITIQDASANCGASLAYSIPSVTIDSKCHVDTRIHSYKSTPSRNTEKSFPLPLSVGNTKGLNAFTVFVKTKGTESCTLSFNFRDPAGNVVDPSFSVVPPGAPNQPPHVSIFEFSGDVSRFDANWEAFYPDNDPGRDMKVKCGLNCDPETSDCGAQDGKGCLPYDASQGTDEIKKGGCAVSSPAYDFAATNKMICLFYDPADISLKKRVNHDFIPINFEIRATEKITTTVGQRIELKVDVANSGTLTDSYTITLAADRPEAVDISPSTVTTGDVSLNKITSSFFSVRPVVDTDNQITVTVSSNANPPTVKTLKIDVAPGLYALPEFGLVGFLQIIAIAAIVYFLLVHRNLGLKKRRKRR